MNKEWPYSSHGVRGQLWRAQREKEHKWCRKHDCSLRTYVDGVRDCPECLAERELPLSRYDEYGADDE